MKKLLFIFSFTILWVSQALAQTWTVQTVPNTRLQSNYIHVSDPDGYLSDSTESVINTTLCAIRDQADVFVVTLYSIGDEEPKHFATSLFNYWGIGDADTDNGVLLLFVEDQHALEFETGYGAEAFLTDAECERIFRTSILPSFRAGDYEGGLIAGVGEIVTVYGGEIPDGLLSIMPTVSYEEEAPKEEVYSDFAAIFLGFLFFIPLISLLRGLEKKSHNKKTVVNEESFTTKRKDGIDYMTNFDAQWSGKVWEHSGCMMFVVFGLALLLTYAGFLLIVPRLYPDAPEKTQNNWITLLTIVTYLTWICIIQNRRALKMADEKAATSKSPRTVYRTSKRDAKTLMTRILAPWAGVFYSKKFDQRINESIAFYCPTCGNPMQQDDHFQLPETCIAEEKAGAYRFTPYRCTSGHEFVFQKQGSQYNNLVVCHDCFARTGRKISERTITEPTYVSQGMKTITYCCQHCNKQFSRDKTIAKLVKSSSSSGSSSSSSSRSSSSSSSGSFGGGSSGGGGYSGRW